MRKETQTEKLNRIKRRIEDAESMLGMALLDIYKLTKESENKNERRT